jgi:GDP-L-fucose synthase
VPRFRTLTADTRIYIAGHRGLVGSALWRHFEARGFRNIFGRASDELDLRDHQAVDRFFAETRPEVVIDAAARVGGIGANSSRQAEFCSDNLRIQLNLFDCAVSHRVERFLFLGSSCIYPKEAEQPIRESAIFTGPLERTNEGYAIAKLAGIGQLKSIRRQYDLPYIAAMPTNLYGPGDNFNLHDSHVLPAMLRRFHEAARDGVDRVTCWGTGKPMREFLYADDLAEACHVLLDEYDDEDPINVGTGADLTIAELAQTVAGVVGYDGEICWDTSKPDGTYRKVLDVGKLADLGWAAKTGLRDGLTRTYRWYLENESLSRR